MKLSVLFCILMAPCLVVSCAVQEYVPVSRPSQEIGSTVALDTKVFSLVNSARLQRGLPAFYRNRGLDQLAQEHSNRLAREAEASGRIHINHAGFYDRAQVARDRLDFQRSAENVGVSAGLSDSGMISESLVRGWMESRGHRKNILGDYKEAGVGVSRARGGRGVYVTQMFGGN